MLKTFENLQYLM